MAATFTAVQTLKNQIFFLCPLTWVYEYSIILYKLDIVLCRIQQSAAGERVRFGVHSRILIASSRVDITEMDSGKGDRMMSGLPLQQSDTGFVHTGVACRNFLRFTLIELLLVVKACQIRKGYRISAPQTREGIGGEKAARKSASLPVPTIPQTTNRPVIVPQQSFRSASGEVEQKREWAFPQKSGKSRSRFCGSFSSCRPTAAKSGSDPYAAPAPCRTPGVRGAADTPPASHDHVMLPTEAPCRTPGVRGGGGHAPSLPRPGNEKSGIYVYRAPRGDCDHRDIGFDAAAGAESGAGVR